MTTIHCTTPPPQTVTGRYLLLITFCLAFSGCQSAQQPGEDTANTIQVQKLPVLSTQKDNGRQVAQSVPASSRDLTHFRAPQSLAGMKLDGEISTDTVRTLLYASESRKESLRVVLSNLPTGWESMDPHRAVASYYSDARQRRVQRALSDPANALSILSETLLDLEGSPAAQAQMRWVEPNRPIQNQSLLVTLLDGTFIRISNASYQQTTRWLLQQAKRSLAEFKAAQE